MLQELTANTGVGWIAIGSTLFFLLFFAVVAWRVLTRKTASYDEVARLPLEDAPPAPGGEQLVTRDRSETGGR